LKKKALKILAIIMLAVVMIPVYATAGTPLPELIPYPRPLELEPETFYFVHTDKQGNPINKNMFIDETQKQPIGYILTQYGIYYKLYSFYVNADAEIPPSDAPFTCNVYTDNSFVLTGIEDYVGYIYFTESLVKASDTLSGAAIFIVSSASIFYSVNYSQLNFPDRRMWRPSTEKLYPDDLNTSIVWSTTRDIRHPTLINKAVRGRDTMNEFFNYFKPGSTPTLVMPAVIEPETQPATSAGGNGGNGNSGSGGNGSGSSTFETGNCSCFICWFKNFLIKIGNAFINFFDNLIAKITGSESVNIIVGEIKQLGNSFGDEVTRLGNMFGFFLQMRTRIY